MNKRCFTFVQCPLDKKCEHAQVDPAKGYFQPEHVGDHCNFFQPRVIESDPWHGISTMMGAHK